MNATNILSRLGAAALAAGCLLLGGCREHNEPAKPIADLSVASVALAAPSAAHTD